MGERVASIKRAWATAVLKSRGQVPTYVPETNNLSAESRRQLRAIDLHFHDLRREFACQLLESSADLHDVRDFLGHTSINTTNAYLSSAPVRQERALQRLEEHRATAPSGSAPESHDAIASGAVKH